MYIIQNGFPHDIKYTMQCRKCKTFSLGDKSEGRLVHDPRDGDALVFKCPKCGNEMWAMANPSVPKIW
jgi:RNase P subunit RPR2